MSSTPSGLKMLHVHRSGQKMALPVPERSGESVSRWNNLAPRGSALTKAAKFRRAELRSIQTPATVASSSWL